MPLTYTGRRVRPGGTEHPGLVDIAVGLSRAARFAGQTKRWFSVIDHSLFCDEMVKKQDDQGLVSWPDRYGPYVTLTKELRLAVLLHDAHESMTGDIPTDWKGKEMKLSQTGLDHLIMGRFFPGGIKRYNLLFHDAVKHFDHRALAAEAQVVGPPSPVEHIVEAFGTTDWTDADMSLLRSRLGAYILGQPPHLDRQEEHPAVKEYIRRVIELL